MPEPFSAEHLNQLRQRWERDPKSRAFLQLAEEYRRAGQLDEAVHVLRAGLKEHPTYLSAQVALGRCLMESGVPDAAAEILERAVARDPTQLVANKLLVEAYLAKGQADKASERLNLYKLFNDRDAEIEPLEARIRALQGLPPSPAAARKSAAARPAQAPPGDALFDLPAVARLPEMDLEPVLALRRSTGARGASEPFGQLFSSGAAYRIESAFAQQGIFALAPPAAPAVSPATAPPVAARQAVPLAIESPAAEAGPVEWESEAWPSPALPDEGATAVAPPPPVTAVADVPVDLDDWTPAAPEPAIAPPLPVSAAPKAASATLGELYLAQGHLDEAEESFQSVLQVRPGDVAALAGLESVRLQRVDEAAAFADEGPVVEESNLIVGGLTARKAALLKDYLARIRRGARRHVS